MRGMKHARVRGKIDFLVCNTTMTKAQIEDTVLEGLRLIAECLKGSSVFNSCTFQVGRDSTFPRKTDEEKRDTGQTRQTNENETEEYVQIETRGISESSERSDPVPRKADEAPEPFSNRTGC